MRYSHWIVDTQTGLKQRLVKPVSGTWERGLNATQQGSHVFRLNNSLSWQQWNDLFDGWRRTLVVCWDNQPVYAGFIIKNSYDYAKDELTVDHTSFRSVLSRRYPFGIGGYAAGTLSIVGQSLRGIVYKLLLRGTQGAPSVVWDLPLSFPAFEEAGPENRDYFNFAFQSIEAAITELTNSENGPDIDFEPFWIPGGRLQHRLRVGGPTLTGPAFEFNASASRPGMILRTRAADFSQLVTGVFSLGKGSGVDKKHGEAATEASAGGYISLDVTRTFSQLEDVNDLNAHSRAEVDAFKGPIVSYAGDVLADRWLPTAQPGSPVAIFRKASNWRPAETIALRATGYAGNITSNVVSLKVK